MRIAEFAIVYDIDTYGGLLPNNVADRRSQSWQEHIVRHVRPVQFHQVVRTGQTADMRDYDAIRAAFHGCTSPNYHHTHPGESGPLKSGRKHPLKKIISTQNKREVHAHGGNSV
jgi:hypothetical protein